MKIKWYSLKTDKFVSQETVESEMRRLGYDDLMQMCLAIAADKSIQYYDGWVDTIKLYFYLENKMPNLRIWQAARIRHYMSGDGGGYKMEIID